MRTHYLLFSFVANNKVLPVSKSMLKMIAKNRKMFHRFHHTEIFVQPSLLIFIYLLPKSLESTLIKIYVLFCIMMCESQSLINSYFVHVYYLHCINLNFSFYTQVDYHKHLILFLFLNCKH